MLAFYDGEVLEDPFVKRFYDNQFRFLTIWNITVCVSFWTIFSYDRALILPPSVDKTITPITNHILHTSIVPIVLWELLFRHRSRPETHLGNLLTINLYAALYLVVIIVAFLEQGVWVYPVLDRLYGTIHFYLFIGAAVVITNVFYKLQWYLTDLVWNRSEDTKKFL
ncbi:hypothetical protein HF086_004327 [Spodoptera exigua]|uniref:Uncharacterized protein n=1 Tax=Spodoptera exigua TaxID=7107 RepID=A0A922MCT7_SPOEX|nr:hypothetical protein HF086_004327 [Spodoptera exigua]